MQFGNSVMTNTSLFHTRCWANVHVLYPENAKKVLQFIKDDELVGFAKMDGTFVTKLVMDRFS
jgi:hypothetical protein